MCYLMNRREIHRKKYHVKNPVKLLFSISKIALRNMLKLGVTGARNGISDAAIATFNSWLPTVTIVEMHHGDCVGADATLHHVFSAIKIPTIIHPPKNDKDRAFCEGTIVLPVRDYSVRNRNIVNSTTCLIAFPSTMNEILRSGTWSTIRYARSLGRPIIIFYPDGSWTN